ncbi:cytochrome P450 [Geopyxis carbonaria]|nr:cytochrome P450 [Geopyxis carbonaria]
MTLAELVSSALSIDIATLPAAASAHPRTTLLVTTALIILPYIFLTSVHRLYLDDLSRFPGPRLAAVSDLWYTYAALTGDLPFSLSRAHAKYGPVVRIAPKQLSFESLRAQDAIYGQTAHGPNFTKSHMYDGLAMSSVIPGMRSMLTQKDPKAHANTRKYFAPCFSTAALAAQEPAVMALVDLFCAKARKLRTIEAGYWFHAFSFDVTGELSFGESFGSIAAEKQHFWVRHILDHFKAAVVFHALGKYPRLTQLLLLAVPKRIKSATHRNRVYAETQVRKRLAEKHPRPDFFTALLEVAGTQGLSLSEPELVGHAASFVIAGSETTGTALSAILYFLAKHPDVAKRLREELHTHCGTAAGITAASTAELPYLNGVIKESMRLYLPVAWGGTRVSDHETVVDGERIPAGVELSSAFFHNARSGTYWSAADEFRPERWVGPADPNDHVKAFQPFSLGPRNCVGRYMAMMEMRLIVSRLVWEFHVELERPSLDLVGESRNYLMWEKPEVWLRFTPLEELEGR